MDAVALLSKIIEILVGGITGIAQGVGSGLSTLATSIFLQTTGEGSSAVTTLSTFGAIIIIFAGISLAIGLCRYVVMWLTSLGAKK